METYGNYEVIKNMESVSAEDAKVGDKVFVWWEYDLTEADYEIVTEDEREYIKQFMMELIKNEC